MPTYSLSDLAKLADVTPRTVRFYISQGLLPSPGQAGPGAHYSDEHLERLRLIRKLQRANMPLAEIRAQLGTLPDDQLQAMADAVPDVQDSAVDYIRDILDSPVSYARAAMPPPRAVPMPLAHPTEVHAPSSAPRPAMTPRSSSLPEPDRSQWERVSIDPDIELHIRRPLTRHNQKRVERLIRIARDLFEED